MLGGDSRVHGVAEETLKSIRRNEGDRLPKARETDPDYLAFLKRSDQVFTPGTLERSISQVLP